MQEREGVQSETEGRVLGHNAYSGAVPACNTTKLLKIPFSEVTPPLDL